MLRRIARGFRSLLALPGEVRETRQLLEKIAGADPLWDERRLRAARESADLVEQRMASAVYCDGWRDLLDCGIDARGEGLVCEFGVLGGTTANYLADRMPNETIHGFDSFEGLPKEWTGYLRRMGNRRFDRRGVLPRVRSNVKLHAGWFQETLPAFFRDGTQPMSLMHIDCDVYSSAKTVLDCAAASVQAGTVIIFDEFFNYPGWRQHEFRAFEEFVERYGVDVEYLGYYQQKVALRVTGKRTGSDTG